MQRVTIRTEMRERLGETAADFWPDATLNRYIDEAQRQFANEERWSWLYTKAAATLTANVATLQLQEDVAINRQFSLMLSRSGAATPLFPKRVSAPEGFRMRASYWNIKGDPAFYYLSAGTLDATTKDIKYEVTFVPTPNVNWDVEYLYLRNPVDLAADDKEPDCPDAYIEAITSWATGMAWLKELNGSSKAQEQFNLYNATLDKARKDERANTAGDPLIVGGAEPQISVMTQEEWVRRRIPNTL